MRPTRGSGADGEILVCGADRRARARAAPTAGCARATSARWTSGGFLRVTGRVADTIVSGGENVAPAEVEAVLEAHPDVLEAAVLGRPDPTWGEAVAAIVVPRPGADSARRCCAPTAPRALARYKVPKQLDIAAMPLPRTASGKLLRRELS